MVAWFTALNPIWQALLATCFTWFLTAVGAGVVFPFRTVNRKVLDGMLGFAAGVMIAVSFWSLLAPAREMAAEFSTPTWIPPTFGFLLGSTFIWGVDKILPHLHRGFPMGEVEGVSTTWRRSILLVLAITLHNFPEGLAIGVAFGAVAIDPAAAPLAAALALTLGIGIQNLPEGMAVSVPLRRDGMSRPKSFWYGQLTGMVEPLAGLIGALAVIAIKPILPYALSFAAGAMIYVVVEELIPESRRGKHSDIPTIGTALGFALMTALEIALG